MIQIDAPSVILTRDVHSHESADDHRVPIKSTIQMIQKVTPWDVHMTKVYSYSFRSPKVGMVTAEH